MSGRLGELLVRENLISSSSSRRPRRSSAESGGRIGSLARQAGRHRRRATSRASSRSSTASPPSTSKDFEIERRRHQARARRQTAVKHERRPGEPRRLVAHHRHERPVEHPRASTTSSSPPATTSRSVVASEQAIREAIDHYYAEKGPTLRRACMQRLSTRTPTSRVVDEERRRPRPGEAAPTSAPVVRLVNVDPPQRHQEAQRHPRGALREGLPRSASASTACSTTMKPPASQLQAAIASAASRS